MDRHPWELDENPAPGPRRADPEKLDWSKYKRRPRSKRYAAVCTETPETIAEMKRLGFIPCPAGMVLRTGNDAWAVWKAQSEWAPRFRVVELVWGKPSSSHKPTKPPPRMSALPWPLGAGDVDKRTGAGGEVESLPPETGEEVRRAWEVCRIVRERYLAGELGVSRVRGAATKYHAAVRREERAAKLAA